MIAYVKGTLEDRSEDNAVVDVGGIGYNIRISADTAARLPGIGEKVKLYTYTSVREDAVQLFGFLSRDDLEIFRKCITVSGMPSSPCWMRIPCGLPLCPAMRKP